MLGAAGDPIHHREKLEGVWHARAAGRDLAFPRQGIEIPQSSCQAAEVDTNCKLIVPGGGQPPNQKRATIAIANNRQLTTGNQQLATDN